LGFVFAARGGEPASSASFSRERGAPRARVVVVHDPEATAAFEPRLDRIRLMVERGLTNLTGRPSLAAAWLSLVSTQDAVGIKVIAAPGPNSGTRPAVVSAIVEGLLQAGLPAGRITIWDKHRAELREAGYFDLAARYGIRVEGAVARGYDEKVFYDTPLMGSLVWGDLEFGRGGEGVGRKSFVSKLVSQDFTKIINVTPLLNHNSAGVSGNLYSLTVGSVDNTLRFEADPKRLAEAVPEIYAMSEVGDRVVLNVVDALICQYQGEQRSLLHYSATLNELRFSKDPVALDVLSLLDLDQQRQSFKTNSASRFMEIYQNASLLELGVSEPKDIGVERLTSPARP
jgi:uncharacterized protein (DUF362 family)